jgi:hypothetical protein
MDIDQRCRKKNGVICGSRRDHPGPLVTVVADYAPAARTSTGTRCVSAIFSKYMR